MRLLLDECVPRRLRRELPNHEVRTVPEMGWAAKENGELLRLAESHFDVLITADQKLRYQQSVSGRNIAVVVLARLPQLEAKNTVTY
jgi:predicted nuclease of predicted toxin-antitoxin system